jgi:hypothetical protein
MVGDDEHEEHSKKLLKYARYLVRSGSTENQVRRELESWLDQNATGTSEFMKDTAIDGIVQELKSSYEYENYDSD